MFTANDLLAYLRRTRYATVSSIGADGAPQSALVGIGVTNDLRIVFDTTSDSRKHANLTRDARASVVVAGPGEQTLQYEGLAAPITVTDPRDEAIREAYYLTWPAGRQRLAWPNLSYWCIRPHWARFTDYDRGPLIAHFLSGDFSLAT
ncbi:MAG TPA: pyridoxamine 5'-phosphate oxidase family protein [Acetobacteraceae bacterium]|jgi:hypothetical protein|nr:pyridoxamine 5'-phosphate oxidase family protein [Acetobacteraceae bacterium]